jgi:hypothetical protein
MMSPEPFTTTEWAWIVGACLVILVAAIALIQMAADRISP